MLNLCTDILHVIFDIMEDESYVALFVCKKLRKIVLSMDIGIYCAKYAESTLKHYNLVHSYIKILESKNFCVNTKSYIEYLLISNNLLQYSPALGRAIIDICVIKNNTKLFFAIKQISKSPYWYIRLAIKHDNYSLIKHIVSTYPTKVVEYFRNSVMPIVASKKCAHIIISNGIQFCSEMAQFIYESDQLLFSELVVKRGIVKSIQDRLFYVSAVISCDIIDKIFSNLDQSDVSYVYIDSFRTSNIELLEKLKERGIFCNPNTTTNLRFEKIKFFEYYMSLGMSIQTIMSQCYKHYNCSELLEHLITKGIIKNSNYTEFVNIPLMFEDDNSRFFELLVRLSIITIQDNIMDQIIKFDSYGCLLKLDDKHLRSLSKRIFMNVTNSDYESAYYKYCKKVGNNIPYSRYKSISYSYPYTLNVQSQGEKVLLCKNILIKSYLKVV